MYQTVSKNCNRCFITKAITDFSKANTCVDGHRNYCKACQKIKKDEWRVKHKEHHNQKCREWTAKNREKRLETQRKYNAKIVASGKSKLQGRAWREKNQERARAYVNYRRRKLRQATPEWADTTKIKLIYIKAQHLKLTVDHIIPITHTQVCGLHVDYNLQLLSARDNFIKNNTFNGAKTLSKYKE